MSFDYAIIFLQSFKVLLNRGDNMDRFDCTFTVKRIL